jgi:hypothetical protein
MLLFLLSTALADPMLIHLREGDVAPFGGRLMNDEAVANIIAGNELTLEQCEIKTELKVSIVKAEMQLEIDYLKAELETEQAKNATLLELRDTEIEALRTQLKPNKTMWAFFGGFLLASGTSLGTYYSVREINENKN